MVQQVSSESSGSSHPLREGLPRSLGDTSSGGRALADLFGLHNHKALRAFLRIPPVREALRTLKGEGGADGRRRTGLDRRRLVAYLSVPANRRLWWLCALKDRREPHDGLPTPSLEMGALRRFDADLLERPASPEGVRSALAFAPEIVDRLGDAPPETLRALAAWPQIESELRGWADLPAERRQVLAAAVFALATLADDDRILRRAVEAAPDLAEEFAPLLDGPANGVEDPVASWEAQCLRLAEAAEEARSRPGDEALAGRMRDVVEALRTIAPAARAAAAAGDLRALLERLRERFVTAAKAANAGWLAEQESWTRLEQEWQRFAETAAAGSAADTMSAAIDAALDALGRIDAERERLEAGLERVRRELEGVEEEFASAGVDGQLAARRRAATLHEEEGRLRRGLDELPEGLLRAASPPAPPEHAPDEARGEEAGIEPAAGVARPAGGRGAGGKEPAAADDGAAEAAEAPGEIGEGDRAEGADRVDREDVKAREEVPGAPETAGEVEAAGTEEATGEDGAPEAEELPRAEVPPQAAEPTRAGAGEPAIAEAPGAAEQPPEADGTGAAQAAPSAEGQTPVPPADEPEAAPEPRAPGPDAGVEAVVGACWRFVEVRRIGLAIATAREGARRGIGGLPPPNLLSAVALADFLRLPDGPVAAGLEEAFAGLDLECVRSGDERERLANRLLLAAAVLRPSLIAPSTGATAFARETSMPEGLTHLYELVDAVREHGERLQWTRIDPAVLAGAKTEAAWTAELQDLRSEVEEWHGQARQMTMLFAPATMVWRRWLERDGMLGRLHEDLLHAGPEAADRVRSAVKLLGDRNRVLALIEETDRKQVRGPRRKAIHARAREQLVGHLAKPSELAQWWLRLMASRPDASDFLDRELGELRRAVGLLSPTVDEELGRFLAEQEGPLACAAETARYAVRRFCVLFDPGHVVRDREPEASRVTGADVLLVPEIEMDEQLEPRDRGGVLDALVGAADVAEELGEPAAFERSFHERLGRGDLVGARAIVEWLEQTDGEPVDALRAALERRRMSERALLKAALGETRRRLELSLAYGQLGESLRARHDAELVRIEHDLDDLWRFDEARARLALIDRELEAARARFGQDALRELDELPIPPDARLVRRVRRAVESGDVMTAFALLDRLRHGGGADEGAGDEPRDPLREFVSGEAEAIEGWLEEVKSAPRVIRTVKEGGEIGGVALGAVPGAQREEAARTLAAWYELKRQRRFSREAVAAVLSGVGIRPRSARLREDRGTWMEVDVEASVISDRDVCPVPHFGSGAGGRYRVYLLWARPTEDDLLQLVREHVGGEAAIVLYLGRLTARRREQLGRRCRERHRSCIVLDETLLLFLCRERGSRARPFFLCALPFSFFEPFVTTASNVPPELFYGRRREQRDIAAKDGPCFIYGGRQLGKTALLREVERRFHDPDDRRYAKWIDLKAHGIGYDREPAAIWPLIHDELCRIGVGSEDWPEPNPNIRDRVTGYLRRLREWFAEDPARRLLLLLDEADRFLELDGRSGGRSAMDSYRESTRLKGLADATGRSFKVVFAGLHNVLRTAGQPNHPLGHFGTPVNVGPLLAEGEWREAEALIRRPLEAAGFRFASEDLVTRILAQTNYYPSLIQLYGSQLFRAASSAAPAGMPPYRITGELVDEVYRDRKLRDQIRERFHLTLQLDQRYEVTAYAMAWEVLGDRSLLAEGLPARRIEEAAVEWWPAGFEETVDFQSLLDEMVGLGVLRRIEDSDDRYTLRNPNVLLLMGTREEVEEVLLRDREPPHEFEPSIFRAPDPAAPDGPRRSPLSFEQEGRLARAENGVTIVCGSVAAGLLDFVPVLEAHRGRRFMRVLAHAQDRAGFERTLGALEQRASGGTTFLVVTSETPWSADWVTESVRRLARLRSGDRFARMVFLADPEHLWPLLSDLEQLERQVEWISLRPWHDLFLRWWLEDRGRAVDPALREAIARATGRWPSMLLRLADGLDRHADVEAALAELEHWIDSPEGRETVLRELGLGGEEARRVLEPLAHFGEASEADLEAFCADSGILAETLRQRLRWASRLHLAHCTNEAWRVDPLAARVLAGEPAPPG